MQRSRDELIAARLPYRLLAGLLCLGEVGVVVGMCGVLIYEKPSGWDWLIVAVFFAAGVIGTAAFGFVAVKGRGPKWFLKWVKKNVL